MSTPPATPADAAVALLKQGQIELAANLMYREYHGKLLAFYKRNSLAHFAEEMSSDTLMDFIKVGLNILDQGQQVISGESVLHLCKTRVLLDYARHEAAQRRGGGNLTMESLDDEATFDALHALMSHQPDFTSQVLAQDCVGRALDEMSKKYPEDVVILRLRVMSGFDFEDVVPYVKVAKASSLRQRLSTALRRAVEYLQHCKD